MLRMRRVLLGRLRVRVVEGESGSAVARIRGEVRRGESGFDRVQAVDYLAQSVEAIQWRPGQDGETNRSPMAESCMGGAWTAGRSAVLGAGPVVYSHSKPYLRAESGRVAARVGGETTHSSQRRQGIRDGPSQRCKAGKESAAALIRDLAPQQLPRPSASSQLVLCKRSPPIVRPKRQLTCFVCLHAAHACLERAALAALPVGSIAHGRLGREARRRRVGWRVLSRGYLRAVLL